MMQKNVAAEVMATGGGTAKKKDVLSLTEIQLLAATETQNENVRKAFLFCCFTGLRWCDVKNLYWKDIDVNAKSMVVLQGKTNVHVFVPLNDTAIRLLGEKEESKSWYLIYLP